MLPVDVRVLQLASNTLIGRPASEVFERFDTPVLKLTRAGAVLDLDGDPRAAGRRPAHGGRADCGAAGASRQSSAPKLTMRPARHLDVDQADDRRDRPGSAIGRDARRSSGTSLPSLRRARSRAVPRRTRAAAAAGRGARMCTTWCGSSARRAASADSSPRSGQAVQPDRRSPTSCTLALGIAIGYAIGLYHRADRRGSRRPRDHGRGGRDGDPGVVGADDLPGVWRAGAGGRASVPRERSAWICSSPGSA